MHVRNPQISIVIPAYNSARFISDALNSAISQNIEGLEIIVVDDGSTDDTRAIVEAFGHDVSYVYQNNRGAAAARNTGVKVAGGEWIAFLDSDDFWNDQYLNAFASAITSNNDFGLYYCGKRWVDENKVPISDIPLQTTFPEGWIFSALFEDNYISSCSCVIVRKGIFENCGGFNEAAVFRNGEDYDLWLRIAAKFRIGALPYPYVNYRRHSESLTQNRVCYELGHLAALKNAANLVRLGKINSENGVDPDKVRIKMEKAYEEATTGLFWNGNYDQVRILSREAFSMGSIRFNIMIRWACAMMPRSIIERLRKYRRKYKDLLGQQ